MNKKDRVHMSWTEFRSEIESHVAVVGREFVITYRDKPQLVVTALVRPAQAIALEHVPWQTARRFDLWTWRNRTPCIIAMGQRRTPVAVVEQWSDGK